MPQQPLTGGGLALADSSRIKRGV